MATKSELIAALRDFCDRLESSAAPEDATYRASVDIHGINTKPDAAALVRMMEKPRFSRGDNYMSISDDMFCSKTVRLVMFYLPGTIGKMEPTLVEKEPDIAELLATN